jgi:hypothetical protein
MVEEDHFMAELTPTDTKRQNCSSEFVSNFGPYSPSLLKVCLSICRRLKKALSLLKYRKELVELFLGRIADRDAPFFRCPLHPDFDWDVAGDAANDLLYQLGISLFSP